MMNYYDEEIEIKKKDDGVTLLKLPSEMLSQPPSAASVKGSAKNILALQQGELLKNPIAKTMEGSDLSESESEDSKSERYSQANLLATSEKWKNMDIPQDVKDIFPYILKYTPQYIETEYHLNPFIPEYVPAVGDVDAFLKVSHPEVLNTQRQKEITENMNKMGLCFLDEPSGQQSEPSVLSIKLRSILTGSAKNASTLQVPVARNQKDIDKWINEVEQVHMGQAMIDPEPIKDVHTLMSEWPQSFEQALSRIGVSPDDSDQSLPEYAKLVCELFGINITEETQAQYISGLSTLFNMYLLVNNNSFE